MIFSKRSRQTVCLLKIALFSDFRVLRARLKNTPDCNLKDKSPSIKMTQSGIKARNQGRRGSEIKDISLSVQTASGLIEQRKTFVDLSSFFCVQANLVIQSLKSVERSFRENVPKLRRAGSTPKWSIFMGQPSRTLSTSMQFSK